MTAFQEERFLRESVESILCQTMPDFELLIMDDGSTDGSPQIMDELAQADERVRVVHLRRSGRVSVLNSGLRLATGRFVALMDADDRSHPDRLRQQAAFLDEHPEIGLVSAEIGRIDEQGRSVERYRNTGGSVVSRSGNATLMGRADILKSFGYREAFPYAEDYDLFARLRDAGVGMSVLNEPLYEYRLNKGSVSILHRRSQMASTINAKISSQRRRSGLDDPFDGESRPELVIVRWDRCPREARPALEDGWARVVLETARVNDPWDAREALDAAKHVVQMARPTPNVVLMLLSLSLTSLLARNVRASVGFLAQGLRAALRLRRDY